MKKTFQSIGYKLLSTLVIATTFPMLIYCFFFSYDMRKSAENSYICARSTFLAKILNIFGKIFWENRSLK